jgi:drug/metabolite transporter (DMT)-like permease
MKTAAAAVITIFFWASAYPVIRVALRAFSPGQLAAIRFLTASLVFALVLALRPVKLPKGLDLACAAGAGALGIAAYNLLLNTGELTVEAGVASFLINCMPVFAALLAVAFLGERLRLIGWLGIAVSLAGVALLAVGEQTGSSPGLPPSLDPTLHPSLHPGLPPAFHADRGSLLVLGASACAALMGLLQKPLLARYSAVAVTACMMGTGGLLLAPFLPGAYRVAVHSPHPVAIPLAAGLYLGVFPAALGYLTWTYVLGRMPLSRAASTLYFVPLVTVAIAYVALGEMPTVLSLAGGVVAILGVVLLSRWGRHAPAGLRP